MPADTWRDTLAGVDVFALACLDGVSAARSGPFAAAGPAGAALGSDDRRCGPWRCSAERTMSGARSGPGPRKTQLSAGISTLYILSYKSG